MVAVAILKKIMRFQSDLEIIRDYHATLFKDKAIALVEPRKNISINAVELGIL